ncbi:ribonuclease H-like domain-containing protein [Tanacetum coccineum]
MHTTMVPVQLKTLKIQAGVQVLRRENSEDIFSFRRAWEDFICVVFVLDRNIKEEYDIWAMEMEHYLEYIDNDVWKVIQNGNSKKRISTRKDGIVRILSPVTAAEIQAVEKERKAKNILLMAIPKEHMRRFHGMDDAKEIWEAIRTKVCSEGLEKGYDRFQQLLSQLEAHGAEVSTEDANHKFLRSLPPAWSNLAMTMRTKPEVDTLSIDDLYNNLRVFEQEIQGASKTSSSAQNVAFVSQSKSNTNKVKSGFTGAYSTCTPSTSSTNIPEKEVLADEVIYSLFAKQSEDWDLLHEDLEQIDDLDIEEMDINWQIAMIAIRMKKFYKKTGRRVRVDGKTPVGFDKKKLECFNCHNTGHFARECTTKGTNDGKKKRDSFYQHQEAGKQEKSQMGLLTMDDGIVNWGEHTEVEETNHALMAISSSNEANEIYEKDEKLKRYRRIGMKAVKEKEQLQKTLDSWKDSSKNLWRLINSGMSSNSKVGLGFEIQSNNEVLSYEEEMNFSVFNCSKEDSVGKPLYNRFTKTNDFKGVPHPLSGDYTPTPQRNLTSLYMFNGKKGPQVPGNPMYQMIGSGNWGSTVKTSASYNWRNTNPNSNCDSGPTFIRTVNAKGSSTEEHGIAWSCRSSTISLVPKPSQFSVQVTTFYYFFRFMAQLKYCDKHNQVGFLRKPDESAGFAEIVDFLRGSNLRYALTTNPTIYDSLVKQFWQTATAKTIADGTLELHATIDTTEYTITEASIRDKLHLADASGITMLPNNEIFEGMGQMGYPTDGSFTFWKSFFTPQWRFLVHHLLHCISSKSGGWDQFGSNIATALICLSTGRVYNFSKLIFDGMVANLKSKTKFLMYPRFLQLILDIQTENKHPYLAVTLTKKIFGNMKRGFRGVPRPLLPAMLLVATTNPNAGQEHPDVAQSQPSSSTIPVPSTSLPPEQSPPPIPTPIPASTPTPIPETDPEPMEHTFEEPSPAHQHFSPPQEHAQEQMSVDDLLQLVPQLMTRVDSLEKDLKQTKLTMGGYIVKVVKKVKNLISTDSINKSIPSPDKGQREGKAPKEQILQEEASLAEAIRLDTLEKEEEAKQVHLDSLLAQRIAEEEELNEQQKKRRVSNVLEWLPRRRLCKEYGLNKFGEELQRKTSKRLKSDEAKDDESTKKTGKRRKQIARKGLHSDKTNEDESKDSKDDDPISESSDIYMLTKRKYPLTAEVCKAMLDKKLQGGKPDEDCYKLLKWMEKQAGIRKHKDWLVQEQTTLGKDFSNPLMADNLPKIVWLSTHHICFNDSPLTGVNTPGSDENSLKLYDLIADMKGC